MQLLSTEALHQTLGTQKSTKLRKAYILVKARGNKYHIIINVMQYNNEMLVVVSAIKKNKAGLEARDYLLF